jgi:hypothetical protein
MAATETCVVDQNFDRAELTGHFVGHSPNLRGVGHVANYGQRPAPDGANVIGDFVDLARRARTDGDLCSSFGQRDGASPANASPAAGDQGDFSVQRVH